MFHRRWHIWHAAVLAALLLATLAAARPGLAQSTISRYTMTAFTNSSESNMYVYESFDATGYTLLRGPAFTPPSGLIRDPSIMKHTDGRYYVTYTTNWTGNTIGFAYSTDRLNWTFYRNHTLPVANLNNTWAPEWYIDSDGSVNIIVSLSTNGGSTFQPHKITAQNSALTAWSNPTPLSGLSPNYIDTFLVKIGGTYHAFVKNETTKYIERATASSLTGPYTFVGTGNWAGWGNALEGPALVQLDNGTWRIYFDAYTTARYYYSDSSNLQSWTAKTDLPGLSGFARHLTVLKERVTGTAPVYENLVARHSGKLADVSNGSTAGGAQVIQWPSNNGTNQHWRFQDAGGGYYRIINRKSNLCLDVNGVSTADGATIIQWTCGSGTNQQWRIATVSGGYIQLIVRHSNKCLDVNGSSTADGATLIQRTCGSGTSQQWQRRTI